VTDRGLFILLADPRDRPAGGQPLFIYLGRQPQGYLLAEKHVIQSDKTMSG